MIVKTKRSLPWDRTITKWLRRTGGCHIGLVIYVSSTTSFELGQANESIDRWLVGWKKGDMFQHVDTFEMTSLIKKAWSSISRGDHRDENDGPHLWKPTEKRGPVVIGVRDDNGF
jgi:hypothetical protein